MRKSNDKILSLMQQAASSKDIPSEHPAIIALLESVIFWKKYDFIKNDRKSFYFIHLTMNPNYFSLPDYRIAQELNICQKCVQNYRSDFKKLFLADYERLQAMSKEKLSVLYLTCIWTLEALGFPSEIPTRTDNLSSRALYYFSSLSSDFTKSL